MKIYNKTFFISAILFLFLVSFVPVHASLARFDQANLDCQLRYAAGHGECGEVEKLLFVGARIDAADKFGMTALHWASDRREVVGRRLIGAPVGEASSEKHADVVRILLGARADVHAADGDGCTALHNASLAGDAGIVGILLGAGADVDAVDENGSTALHFASSGGCEEVVRLLLEVKADVDAVDENGSTALHEASFSSCAGVGVTRELLHARANVHAVDEENKTPFIGAIMWREIASAKLLASYGADIEEGLNKSNLTKDGKAAIRAAQKAFQDAVCSIVDEIWVRQYHMQEALVRLTVECLGGRDLLAAVKNRQQQDNHETKQQNILG